MLACTALDSFPKAQSKSRPEMSKQASVGSLSDLAKELTITQARVSKGVFLCLTGT